MRLPGCFFSAALSLALALGPGHAAGAPAHRVDLRAVWVTDEAVFAPLGAGGAKVKLTLDPRLQRAAGRILARSGAHEGAIVASDVRTGRILAWAARGDRDYVAVPFAPSASLFKLVTASALLESGRVSPATRECFDGGEHALTPRDLEGRGSTCIPFGDALGYSVNAVIARLAKKHLSPSELRRYAKELGFAGEVPIDVPVGASEVTIPEDPFGMARASAGFWNGHLSPLGALFAMQTIANGGERVRFSILDHGAATPRVSAGRALRPAVARTLVNMLEETTRKGTAFRAFHHADGSRALPGIAVSAKTGTLIGGHPTRMYSWFAAFAPSSRPEIAVTVMLGNDLSWHTKANIAGREFLEAYFGQGEAAPGGARPARPMAARTMPRRK
jgi:cell division protein FtsI/penicillin-binding protein 2